MSEPTSSRLFALAADIEDVLLRFHGHDFDAETLARVATELARLGHEIRGEES